ncbi:peptidoglycan -binding protein [Ostreiculturibacter nitratireducens]|uniref:peptidoglycan -binding protein n=1 Tax=Ostreiculturibacter nitratireducens TaxID=3075226 RepID=UPI0031B6217E
MALGSRGQQRFSTNIWPGFVDAITSLLMVMMFVLTIFMIVQSVLRETISTQDDELDALSAQVASLADALGLERGRSAELENRVAGLSADLDAAAEAADAQAALIATLNSQLADERAALSEAQTRITSFEAQVAALLSQRDSALGEVAALSEARDKLLSEQEALNLALATARQEIDAQEEAARLAAARREALEALVADLRARNEEDKAALENRVTELETELSEAEKVRLAEAAAAAALRERLKSSADELTAMTLALEEQRKQAEETLTLLAAAEAARRKLDAELAAVRAAGETTEERLTQAERDAALLAVARAELAEEKEVSAEAARKVALLNEQIAALRSQLGSLQALLDASAERDKEAKVQIEALGTQLNTALARVAAEERRRAELEEAERKRLEEEAAGLQATAEELAKYRSEFFGRLREILSGREGVRVVGDRFVFSSEVLFETGSADLAPEGREQIASVSALLLDVAEEIPPGIDWILRVDGHTDNVPVNPGARYADNWELSQARALSVVRFMTERLGFPPERLAATGFGEYQPVAEGDTPEALAQNRRIELKLTER